MCVQQGRIYIGPANKDLSHISFNHGRYVFGGGPNVDPPVLNANVEMLMICWLSVIDNTLSLAVLLIQPTRSTWGTCLLSVKEQAVQ